MNDSMITAEIAVVHTPKTVPFSVQSRMSNPTRNRMSAISRKIGMDAFVTGMRKNVNGLKPL